MISKRVSLLPRNLTFPFWQWLLAALLAVTINIALHALLRRLIPLTLETDYRVIHQWRFWSGLLPLILLHFLCCARFSLPANRTSLASATNASRPGTALSERRGLLGLALSFSIALYFWQAGYRSFIVSLELMLLGGPGPAALLVPLLLTLHALCAFAVLLNCLAWDHRATPSGQTRASLDRGSSWSVRAVLASGPIHSLLVSTLVVLAIWLSVAAARFPATQLGVVSLAWFALVILVPIRFARTS